jgi:hypothetical protein
MPPPSRFGLFATSILCVAILSGTGVDATLTPTTPETPAPPSDAPATWGDLIVKEATRVYDQMMTRVNCLDCVNSERARLCDVSALAGARTEGVLRISDFGVLSHIYNTWSMLRDKMWMLNAMFPAARAALQPTMIMEDAFARHWSAYSVANGIEPTIAWPMHAATCEMMNASATSLSTMPAGVMTNAGLSKLVDDLEIGYVKAITSLAQDEHARWGKSLTDLLRHWQTSRILRRIPMEDVAPTTPPAKPPA